ncbi:hypothetical protein AVEN_114312-1 [Araneus ventricosus]|uniref:Mos1 transposase HTH domain-containing protein n=1 Tax=Araneus ventricosus TaxID=182803 RepID=A0A4Y2NAK4_ARAVE|nr:hypothetical protein AVEN_114312-1 [Araneus ventricosus]
MVRNLDTYSKVQVRGTARFLWAKRFKSREIHCEVSAVYGPHVMLRPAIVKWGLQFEDGRTDLTNVKRQGRATTVSKRILHGALGGRYYSQQWQSERRTHCTGFGNIRW